VTQKSYLFAIVIAALALPSILVGGQSRAQHEAQRIHVTSSPT